jgi:hypothetical protein
MDRNGIITQEVTEMFERVLDFAQVACPPANWAALRSKILRYGNNCIRNLIAKIGEDEDEIK